MSESSCTPYDRERAGFSIQSVSPSAVVMLETISKDTCVLPRGVNALTLSASELLQIRQTFSECTITPSGAIAPIDAPTQLAILQTKQNNSRTIIDFLSYLEGRGPGDGILDTNFGWDSDGVWFSGNAGEDPSYPIFTNFTIPSNQQVEVTVEFVYNQRCADFGLCFYQDDTVPDWDWGSNPTRIACSYNCETPAIYGLTTENDPEVNLLIPPNTYTCNVIYNPNSNPNITLTTTLNGTTVDTRTLDNQVLTSAYRIGFSADQDNEDFRTYIKNLTINVNNGEQIYESSLQNVAILPFL